MSIIFWIIIIILIAVAVGIIIFFATNNVKADLNDYYVAPDWARTENEIESEKADKTYNVSGEVKENVVAKTNADNSPSDDVSKTISAGQAIIVSSAEEDKNHSTQLDKTFHTLPNNDIVNKTVIKKSNNNRKRIVVILNNLNAGDSMQLFCKRYSGVILDKSLSARGVYILCFAGDESRANSMIKVLKNIEGVISVYLQDS